MFPKASSTNMPERILPQLPPELSQHIATFLPCNDIPILRLLNKAAAGLFRLIRHRTIRLSQPSLPEEFTRKWGSPEAWRGLTLDKRRQLLRLTAASGSVPNLSVAFENAGWPPTADLLEAAAAANQLDACKWLLQRGCPDMDALQAAASAGHRDACELLLGMGRCTYYTQDAACAAASHGHITLAQWLRQIPLPVDYEDTPTPDPLPVPWSVWLRTSFVAAAAKGWPLAELQALHGNQLLAAAGGDAEPGGAVGVGIGAVEDQDAPQRLLMEAPWEELEALGPLEGNDYSSWYFYELDKRRILSSAAGSITPDWRGKVEWLEGQGHARTTLACIRAASCPDAVERLTWLLARGYPLDARQVASAAARAGNIGALRLLRAAGVAQADMEHVVYDVANKGNLPMLQFLAEEGVNVSGAPTAAAYAGHLHLVAWLAEAGLIGQERAGCLFYWACESGSVKLLEWLSERGYQPCDDAVRSALQAGCVEAVEWLVERGCLPPGEEVLRERFASNATVRYMPMLRCLLQLQPGLMQDGEVFAKMARDRRTSLATLRWFLAEGGPDLWGAAEAAVKSGMWDTRLQKTVLRLIGQQRQRHEDRQRQGA